MAPKVKKQKEIVQDERFQAIVLTDSFETRFMPLVNEVPRCLIPLANVPLIEYTLEFLAKSGVNEVYLMCCAHADKIQEYISRSKWSSANSPFKITCLLSLESRSVGDAMRDLDNRGLITGDFLLVSGDVVTNIDFSTALAFHKSKKAADRDYISTMVLTPASPLHKTRSPVDPAVFVLDKTTNRCAFYKSIPPIDGKKSSISIDPEILERLEDNDVMIRNDLIDCHVDICTPHVPSLFQDNFDYQYLRSDFVKGVVMSDVLRKSIYAYIHEGDEYAARVESWSTYNAISQDVLARWCYPMVPDANLIADQKYSYEFKHIYKEENVILAQSCKIGTRTCIGAKTIVGDGSDIAKSVIGRNCVIGKNVKIINSYIWDDVVIEDNVVIDHCVVAKDVRICSGCTIKPESVLGFRVKIGEGKTIQERTRIVDHPIVKDDGFGATFSDEDDDEIKNEDSESESKSKDFSDSEVNDASLVGEDGIGFLYTSDSEDESDSEFDGYSSRYSGMMYKLKTLNLSDESIASATNYNRRKQEKAHRATRQRRFSSNSMASTDFDDALTEDEEEDFEKEAIATVERAIDNNHDLDTAVLELNTLKMSMNVGYHELREATTQALIIRIDHFITTETLDPKAATEKVFRSWGKLYERQVFEPNEQVDLLDILQAKISVTDKSYNQKILFFAVSTLYDMEILEEENIYIWWDSPKSSATPELATVKESTGRFVDWLRDAEEED